MRKYITLIRHHNSDEQEEVIQTYLRQQGIKFTLEADLESEIDPAHHWSREMGAFHYDTRDPLIYKYTFLGTDDDVTALNLIYGDIKQVEPSSNFLIRNWIRKNFSIFFS